MNPRRFSDAAHELNNLLQIVALRTSQLSSALPESGPLRNKIKEIEDDLWRVVPMVRGLLSAKNSGEHYVPAMTLMEPAVKIPAASSRESGSFQSPVILYIDDNPDRVMLLKPILELNGYRVLTAENGKKGLEIFLTEPVELVVLDYFMPAMKGDEVAKKMRQLRPEVPIVIFSGALTLPEMVIAMIDGFVSTSEEPGTLLNIIGSLLQRSQAQAC